MKHILRNPIGEALAAVGIAWAEVAGWVGDRVDRRWTRWANDTHEAHLWEDK